MPISVQAIGVFVAPEKTATNPIPAIRPIGSGKTRLSALPKVAPIKNNGVTSPPLNPTPIVKVRLLQRKRFNNHRNTKTNISCCAKC